MLTKWLTNKAVLAVLVPGVLTGFGWLGTTSYQLIHDAAYTTGFNECEKKHLIEHEETITELVTARIELRSCRTDTTQ